MRTTEAEELIKQAKYIWENLSLSKYNDYPGSAQTIQFSQLNYAMGKKALSSFDNKYKSANPYLIIPEI